MNLRDIVSRGISFVDLSEKLIASPFDIDDEAVPVIFASGLDYRNARAQIEAARGGIQKEINRRCSPIYYDGSPENRILLSHVFHQLQKQEFDITTLQLFSDFMNVIDEGNLNMAYSSGWYEPPASQAMREKVLAAGRAVLESAAEKKEQLLKTIDTSEERFHSAFRIYHTHLENAKKKYLYEEFNYNNDRPSRELADAAHHYIRGLEVVSRLRECAE